MSERLSIDGRSAEAADIPRGTLQKARLLGVLLRPAAAYLGLLRWVFGVDSVEVIVRCRRS